MRNGVDYSTAPTEANITALRAAGITFVSRYLSYSTNPRGKNLTTTEVGWLRRHGISIVSNWEWYGDWLHDYSGGFGRGQEHAETAAAQHLGLGGPPTRPIYFSTDFDPTAAQMPTVADYYRGVASVIGLARTGAYGGYRTIKYLFDHGVIRWGWQTYAWSGGQWDPRAQVRQTRNSVALAGLDVDLDTAMVDDFGQWDYSASKPVTEVDDMLRIAVVNGKYYVGNGVTRRTIIDWPEHNALVAAGAIEKDYGTDAWSAWGAIGRIDMDYLNAATVALGGAVQALAVKAEIDAGELAAIQQAAQAGAVEALGALGDNLAVQLVAALQESTHDIDAAAIQEAVETVMRRILADAGNRDQPPAS
jgi:hypothetical protein